MDHMHSNSCSPERIPTKRLLRTQSSGMIYSLSLMSLQEDPNIQQQKISKGREMFKLTRERVEIDQKLSTLKNRLNHLQQECKRTNKFTNNTQKKVQELKSIKQKQEEEKLAKLQDKQKKLQELDQFRGKLKEDRLNLKQNIEKKKTEIYSERNKVYKTLKEQSKLNEQIKKQHQSFNRDLIVQKKVNLKSTILTSRHQRVFSARFIRENIEKEYDVRMKQETLAKEHAEKTLEKLSKIESQILDILKKSCEDNDKALDSLLELTCPNQKSVQVLSVENKLSNPEAREMSPEREVPKNIIS